MNWVIAASLLSPLITLIGVAYIAGTYKQRIVEGERDRARQWELLAQHTDKIEDHENRITRGEAWREGYSAGQGKTGR